MDEVKLAEHYKAIAAKLDEIVPDSWERIALYAEEKEDTRYASFYYFTEDAKRHFSGAIPFAYDISFEKFDNQLKELKQIIRKLWQECKESGDPVWYSFTFDLQKDWQYTIKYCYERNDEISGWEGEMRWAYDEFGQIPTSRAMKHLLEKYLIEQGRTVPEYLWNVYV